MPRAVQLNLELQNEPGTLARLCRDLADRGINLLALHAPEIANRKGPIRLLVTNPDLAPRNVAEAGYEFTREEVLYVELKNRPGALAKTMEKLAAANIDVKYTYATALTRAQKTAAVISVSEDDLPEAQRLLG